MAYLSKTMTVLLAKMLKQFQDLSHVQNYSKKLLRLLSSLEIQYLILIVILLMNKLQQKSFDVDQQ